MIFGKDLVFPSAGHIYDCFTYFKMVSNRGICLYPNYFPHELDSASDTETREFRNHFGVVLKAAIQIMQFVYKSLIRHYYFYNTKANNTSGNVGTAHLMVCIVTAHTKCYHLISS